MGAVVGYGVYSCLAQLTFLLLLAASHARFRDKPNSTYLFEPLTFNSDEAIVQYLNARSRDVKLWHCKNGVEVTYRRKPATFELYCEILGRVKSIEFTHHNQLLDIGYKYTLTAYPHRVGNKFLSRWLDYSLRVNDPNRDDSGMYSIKVTGASGLVDQQLIFVSMKKVEGPEVRAGKRPGKRTREDRRQRRRRRKRLRKNRKSRRRSRKEKYRWQTQFLT